MNELRKGEKELNELVEIFIKKINQGITLSSVKLKLEALSKNRNVTDKIMRIIEIRLNK